MDKIDIQILKQVMKRCEYISDHIPEIKDTDLLKHITSALQKLYINAEEECFIKDKIDELL